MALYSQAADDQMTPPSSAWYLGMAGMLPTIGACLAVGFGNAEWLVRGYETGFVYGALILSFLGGTWWGLTTRIEDRSEQASLFAWSVVPPLVAWVCLFDRQPASLLLLAALFLAALRTDWRLGKLGVAPRWWMRLRAPLSIGMCLLHLLLATLYLWRSSPA